eukprot:INCI7757.1.p1 GENE.INCI7757.1~~INCI7757.1.p1  ORF type:complete len:557 (-),score=89.27 INCI7757.1:47-1717(-)
MRCSAFYCLAVAVLAAASSGFVRVDAAAWIRDPSAATLGSRREADSNVHTTTIAAVRPLQDPSRELLMAKIRRQNDEIDFLQHQLLALQAAIERQSSRTSAERSRLDRRLEELLRAVRAPWPEAEQRGRKLTGPSCDEQATDTGAELVVNGVCSCAEGFTIGVSNHQNVSRVLRELTNAANELFVTLNLTLPADSGTTAAPTTTEPTYNCTALSAPVIVGSIIGDSTNMHSPHGVAVAPNGQYVYVASYTSNSLVVIDVSNVDSPAVVGAYRNSSTLLNPWGVAVSPDGSYVYVSVVGGDGISVFNVVDPQWPTLTGTVVNATNMKSAYAVSVSPGGRYVYVTGSASNSLAVVDVANPAVPKVVGSIVEDGVNMAGPFGVAASPNGKYVFVTGSRSASLAIVDVTEPTAPFVTGSIVGDFSYLKTAMGVAVSTSGSHVYVAGGASDTLAVVDVSSPNSPLVVGAIADDATNLNGPNGVAVDPNGGSVCVACGEIAAGFSVVDVTESDSPVFVGSLTGDTTDVMSASQVAVSPSGTHAFVTATNFFVIEWQNCTALP